MVLNVPVKELLDKLGHDGSEILWPDQPEPLRRKAFHYEEFQMLALDHYGVVLCPFLIGLQYSPTGENAHTIKFDLQGVLDICDGVLLGSYIGSNKNHAVAWNATERLLYDPSGPKKVSPDTFQVNVFLAAFRSGS